MNREGYDVLKHTKRIYMYIDCNVTYCANIFRFQYTKDTLEILHSSVQFT